MAAPLELRGKILGAGLLSPRQKHGAFDGMRQLAHVAGPGVGEEKLERCDGESAHRERGWRARASSRK